MTLKSRYLIPSIHIFIWLALLSIPALVFRDVKFDTGLPGNFFFLSNLFHITLFYFNAYWLYPKFFNKRTWWLYFILIIALIVAVYRGKVLILQLIDTSITFDDISRRIIFFPAVPFLAASFIFRIVIDRNRLEKLEKEKQAERLASELKFLRSQVSPHFIFNVLTNMVSLARKKSESLEPALIQLSDLLRYMLYETGNNQFPLDKEIGYLQNYLELQKLRFGDDASVDLSIQYENQACTIEPMLLIPFVENAFKHGIGMLAKPYIKIRLEVQNGQMSFSVINNYNRDNQSKDKNSGIGIANVKHRLDLLYKNNYELRIDDNGEIYAVNLNLRIRC